MNELALRPGTRPASSRRRLLRAAANLLWLARLAATAAGALVLNAAAQTPPFPDRPLTIVVPYPVGGPVDIVGRVVAEALGRELGQPVVVENRTGASGNIGTEFVARSPADGYTLVSGSLGYTISASFYPKLPFDPKKDFAPVTMVGATSYVLAVNPAVPARNVKELVALSKSNPDGLNFSSSGKGSGNHLAVELIKIATGARMTHVPYRGSGQAAIALLGGEVQIGMDGLTAVATHVKAGKLRALAVTGPERSDLLPDVPTLAESGYTDVVVVPWYGLLAPAGTPKAVIDRIARDVASVLAEPDTKRLLKEQGVEAVGDSPEHFAAFLDADFGRWAKVIGATGIRAD